jgi:hypothetical protein
MAPEAKTARDFILETLSAHPDRELQAADLSVECGGRFTKGNLHLTLGRLLQDGKVVKTVDDDRSSWWAIATKK